jgi:hypothetical protein
MTADRYTFYRDIHKGIRALLSSLVERAGQTDYTNPRQVSALKQAVDEGFFLLKAHAHHEETFIEPLVRAASPAVGRALDAAHEEQEGRFPQLRSLLTEASAAGPSADRLGHAFTVALSRFAGEMLVHMADEEERAMPALQAAMTDRQLMDVEQALVASVPPDKMARYLAWMLPAMSSPHRAGMLAEARKTAPPEVFEGLLAVAGQVLSFEQMQELYLRLGVIGDLAA